MLEALALTAAKALLPMLIQYAGKWALDHAQAANNRRLEELDIERRLQEAQNEVDKQPNLGGVLAGMADSLGVSVSGVDTPVLEIGPSATHHPG